MSRIAVEAPPPIDEVVELFTQRRVARSLDVKIAIMHYWKSDTYGFRDTETGALVAVFGFAPVEDVAGTVLEMWFMCRRSIIPHLVAIAHVARLTLARTHETSGLTILARVAHGHAPGQRLAGIIGLTRVGEDAGFDLWAWQSIGGLGHEQNSEEGRQLRHGQRQRRAETASATASATAASTTGAARASGRRSKGRGGTKGGG